jgi:hypothetical protein
MSLPTDANPDSLTPPAGQQGQPTDWEARFKGLQREFNTLNTTKQALEQQLAAKETVNTNLATENAALKMGQAETAAKYESQLTDLRAQLGTANQTITTKDGELTKLTGKLGAMEKEATVRKAMSAEYRDLLPFVDSGYLKPLDADGNPLEGDALKTHLEGFKAMLSGQQAQALDTTLAGTKPQVGQPAGTAPGAKTQDELRDWLDKNGHLDAKDPDWVKHSEAYIDLVSKAQGSNPLTPFR